MEVIIKKGLPSGVFNAPPSKSYAHRLLICSALSGEECTVSGIAPSEDILATLDSVKALGPTPSRAMWLFFRKKAHLLATSSIAERAEAHLDFSFLSHFREGECAYLREQNA